MEIPCLITGGSGFLGWHLVRELRAYGEAHGVRFSIRILDLHPPDPDLPGEIDFVEGDITRPEDVARAVRGMALVFHGASLIAWTNDDAERIEAVNVGGTRTLLAACVEADVRALVHTSSQDVLWSGEPVLDADESWPLPAHHGDAYSRSKALSEEIVLEADASTTASGGQLRTCAVRPCGMWGERDPYHLDNVLAAAASGKLVMRVGNGRSRFQHVYVGNVAHAQVLAGLDLLGREGETVAGGQAYFVTDEPAANFFDFLAPIVEEIGHPMPPRSRYLPFAIAHALGAAAELTAKLVRPICDFQPRLTRNSVSVLCTDFTFRDDKIRRELGYLPRHSAAEARRRTVAHYRERLGP